MSIAPNSQLEEATLLQQPSHLLILPFPRFPLETDVPELVSIVMAVRILVEALFKVGKDRCDCLEVVRLGLPPFDVMNDFCCFLSLAEVDHVVSQPIASSVVDEGQRRQVNT